MVVLKKEKDESVRIRPISVTKVAQNKPLGIKTGRIIEESILSVLPLDEPAILMVAGDGVEPPYLHYESEVTFFPVIPIFINCFKSSTIDEI